MRTYYVRDKTRDRGGSIQNVLQEGVGSRQTITRSTVMPELWIQLLAEGITHMGPVHPCLMLTPNCPLG